MIFYVVFPAPLSREMGFDHGVFGRIMLPWCSHTFNVCLSVYDATDRMLCRLQENELLVLLQYLFCFWLPLAGWQWVQ